MLHGVIPKILAKQTSAGNWVDPRAIRKYGARYGFLVETGYLPKYRGNIWQLLIFAELGADGTDPRIRKACDYVIDRIYTEQNSDGLFTYDPAFKMTHSHSPCLIGNMVFSFSKLGYQRDERVKKARDWLIKYQRFDDGVSKAPEGWPYDRYEKCWGKHTCHMCVVKALKALAEIPVDKRSRSAKNTIEKGAEYLLKHHIYKRSHDLGKISKPGWLRFGFPLMWNTDVLEIVGILASLGYKDKRMQETVDFIDLNCNSCAGQRLKYDRTISLGPVVLTGRLVSNTVILPLSQSIFIARVLIKYPFS